MTAWLLLAEQVRSRLKVVREDGKRMVAEYGRRYVKLQDARMQDRPAVEIALIVGPAADCPTADLAAANENVGLGELELSSGSVILRHRLPLERLGLTKLLSTIATLAGEVDRLQWLKRTAVETSQAFSHFSD